MNEDIDNGVWPDHTTQVNRYDNFVGALYGRADFDDSGELDILDVGSSTGEASRYFADQIESEYGVETNVIGADVGEKAANKAGTQLDAAVQADARNLPFEDDSFDIVTCKTLLSRIRPEDQAEALSEIERVASDEAYVAVEVDSGMDDRPVTGENYVLRGDELSDIKESTEGFEKLLEDELEGYETRRFFQSSEEPVDAEVYNEGDFLGATMHQADKYKEEEEAGGEENMIIA